jgi:beta-glucan synthesis-associated protein KRE6
MDIPEAMKPPSEAPPIAERGKDLENTGEIMQAGRSDSSLNAEQNAAGIRTRGSSTASGPSEVNTPASQSTTIQLENPTTPPSSSVGRRASYAPRSPSPLNPSTSSSSVNSNGGAATLDEKQNDQSPSKPRKGGAFSRRRSRPGSSLTPIQELLRQKSMPNLRPERPRHLKDLERRYSLYPAMGLDSRRQSIYNTRPTRVSSTTHLLESRSSTALLVATSPSSETTLTGESEKLGMVDDMSSFNPYCGGEKGLFILYANELENDDNEHMPKDNDDFAFKPKFSDYFNRRAVVSTIGGVFLILGILSLFIVLPVIYFTGIAHMQLPGVDWDYWPDTSPPDTWATVNHRDYSLLNNVRRGLIDPDTPESARIRKGTFDDADLNLVFSDEFNRNNRTFYPGDDPYWTTANTWYGAM